MKKEPVHKIVNTLWVAVLITLMVAASSNLLVDSASAQGLSAPHVLDHSGTISTTETWLAADNPHRITAALTISASGKVLLEPGVEIQINSNVKLIVQGVLTTTVSAPATPIVIRRNPSGGNFGQIDFQANSSGHLANCDISQGGSLVTEVILINSATAQGVTLENCRIHDNAPSSQVIFLNNVAVKAKLANLTIDNNSGAMAIAQSYLRSTPVYDNITLQNNGGGDFLEVGRTEAIVQNTNKITLTGNEFLPNGVIALVKGATINAGGALTATIGTNFQISPGQSIIVQATNVLSGRFYADGVNFAKRPGQSAFGLINFSSYSIGYISNCNITEGGSGAGITEVVKISSSDVVIENCDFYNNTVANRVIYLGGGTTDVGLHPTLRNLEFYTNTAPYIVEQINVDMVVTYDNLYMHDNSGAREGVYLGTGTLNRGNVLDQVELNGAPYYVGNTGTTVTGLTIAAGGGITLTAGTELRVLPGRPITVQGKLVTQGTALQPVYLRSVADAPLQAEQWGYLDIKSTATVQLNYCDISHAAGGVIPAPVSLPAVVSIASSNTSVSHCNVHDNVGTADTFAVLMAGVGNTADIVDTTITNNSGWGLGQNSLNMIPTYQNLTLTGNNGGVGDLLLITGAAMATIPDVTNYRIYLDSPAINGRPIYLPNGVLIAATGVITVTPSTTLYVGTGTPGKKIEVNGKFIAVGGSAVDQHIKIQNRGASAGDNFGEIDFKIGSTGHLMYSEVLNGGKGFTEMVRIDSTNVVLEDSTFSGSIGTAQTVSIVSQNLKPTLRNLVIQNGKGYAVAQASANMAPIYDNLLLQGNDINGVYLNTSTGVNQNLTLNIDELNGAPYYAGSMTFLTGKAITITAGTELRLLSAAVLTINTGARLEMVGSPQRWITVRPDKLVPTVTDYWNSIDIKNGATARFKYCDLSGGGKGGVSVLLVATSSATPTTFAFDYCNIHNNGTGGGTQNTIAITGVTAPVSYAMQNVVVSDNNAGGIYVTTFVNLDLKHVSLLRNIRHGVQTGASGVIRLYNSIIAWNGTGFISGGTANTSEANAVLWYGNTPKFTGNPFIFQDNWDAYELPMAWDGYHLSRYATEALNYTRAAATGVVDDIDSEVRPQPAGTAVDLGADEYVYNPGQDFAGEKAPFNTKWVYAAAGSHLLQKYLVRVYQGLPGQNLTISVQDAFPSGLAFTWEEHPSWMSFSNVGNALSWQANQSLGTGEAAMLLMEGTGTLANGTTILNTGMVNTGAQEFKLGAKTTVPVFKPLIASPLSGSVCSAGVLSITGSAQPGASVKIYANGVLTTTVTANSVGFFSAPYNYAGGTVALTAEACFGSACSGQGTAVNLSPCSVPQSAGTLGGMVYDLSLGMGHPVSGVTVTLMISLPEWGGWVPWPAELYSESNPKVTSGSGTYNFTNVPPGKYYVQAAALTGYQSHRSAAATLVSGGATTINVPYAARPSSVVQQIVLGDSGPNPANITIQNGTALEWFIPVDGMARPSVLVGLVENPVVRLLSSADPAVTGSGGWDSGLLYPGQSFRHTFTLMGVFTYNDGRGHTGTITVTERAIVGLALQVDSPAPHVTGTPVLFSASVIDGSSPVYTWGFGDGATGTGQSVSHTYAATGTYTVAVTATNTVSTLTTQTTITVTERSIVGLALQVDSPAPYVTGNPVLFSASVVDGSSPLYTWDFGDGATGTGQSTGHTYTARGTFTITVKATNTVSTQTVQTTIDVLLNCKIYLPMLRR